MSDTKPPAHLVITASMTDNTPAGRIRAALTSIRDNWDDTLEPARRAQESHALMSMVNPPLPVPADVLDTRARAHERLAYWSWYTLKTRHLHLLEAADPPALATFLLIHADWLAGFPKALAELESSAAQLGVIAAQNAPRHQDVGPCPGTQTDGSPCQGTVKATVRADDDLLPSTLVCTGTPTHEWPAGVWRTLERRIHAQAGVARREAEQRRAGMDEGAARRLLAAVRVAG